MYSKEENISPNKELKIIKENVLSHAALLLAW